MTSKPRRILHLLNSAAGGAAVSTTLLMEGLRQRGVESCAVCHPAGSMEERERLVEAAQGQLLFTPLYWWNRKTRAAAWKRPLLQLMQLPGTGWGWISRRRVQRFAEEQRVELIHTNTIVNPEGGWVARQLGLPHVWHLRERIGPGEPFRLPVEGRAFGRYMAHHASLVVANSQATAELIEGWLPPEQLAVIPNGVDLSHFRPRQHPSDGRVIVAMVANLTSRVKRHDLFVEAAGKLAGRSDVEFRIYGHDPTRDGGGDRYTEALHSQVRQLGLESHFSFSGFVADPARIMEEIDILVHPTEVESFGRVAVEAMAAEVPVVGVAGGGIGEIVVPGETGLLARVGDTAGLASAVERLVEDPALRQRMGKAGRRRAEERYSLEAHVEAVLAVYRNAPPLGG